MVSLAMLALAIFACEGRRVIYVNTQTARDAWQNMPNDPGARNKGEEDSGSAQGFDSFDSADVMQSFDTAQNTIEQDAGQSDTGFSDAAESYTEQPADAVESHDAQNDAVQDKDAPYFFDAVMQDIKETDATQLADASQCEDISESTNDIAQDNKDLGTDNNPDIETPPQICCFKVYTNEARGFSFEYPEEWTVLYSDENAVYFDSAPEQHNSEENRIYVEVEYMPSGDEIGGYDEDFVEELQKSFFDKVACAAGQLAVNISGTGEHFAIFAIAPLEQGNLAINMRYMYPRYEKIEWAKEVFAHLVLSLKML